jgi:hypothetical protein
MLCFFFFYQKDNRHRDRRKEFYFVHSRIVTFFSVEYKVHTMQNSSSFCFSTEGTYSDAEFHADHEYDLKSSKKPFLWGENCKIL